MAILDKLNTTYNSVSRTFLFYGQFIWLRRQFFRVSATTKANFYLSQPNTTVSIDLLLWVDVERLYQPRKKLHDVNNIYFQTQIHFQTPDLKKSQQKTEIKNPKYNQLDKINTQLDRTTSFISTKLKHFKYWDYSEADILVYWSIFIIIYDKDKKGNCILDMIEFLHHICKLKYTLKITEVILRLFKVYVK